MGHHDIGCDIVQLSSTTMNRTLKRRLNQDDTATYTESDIIASSSEQANQKRRISTPRWVWIGAIPYTVMIRRHCHPRHHHL
mmetsp:Transcript_19372/g.45065  ORF Transcript_19372/g.45065 Transcript_19372/m.45065 type:complete len:82 (+) Transcript_19372:319-564(+)